MAATKETTRKSKNADKVESVGRASASRCSTRGWMPTKTMVSKPQSIEEVKKACHFGLAKCCSHCKWHDNYEEDYGANHQEFCSNPNNEFEDAKPGEDACIDLLKDLREMVCDHFEWKEGMCEQS